MSSLSTKSSSKVDKVIDGVQISIDRLAQAFEKSLTSQEVIDPLVKQRGEAVKHITHNDSVEQYNKSWMINLFIENPAMADIYLAIDDKEVRKGWIDSVLTPVAV
jgi:hypothetical protein